MGQHLGSYGTASSTAARKLSPHSLPTLKGSKDMKPNEALAVNLKKHLKRNDITAHALGKSGKTPQKTVWSCLTGKIAPSVNTVFDVCEAVDLDASIITRKEYEAEEVRHSKRVGLVADDLMTLSFEQIKFIADVVKGLMPSEVNKPSESVRYEADQPAEIVRAEIKMAKERRVTEKRRRMTPQYERETYLTALKQVEIKREKAKQREVETAGGEIECVQRREAKANEANRQMTLDGLNTRR